jgi:hypothetical protein
VPKLELPFAGWVTATLDDSEFGCPDWVAAEIGETVLESEARGSELFESDLFESALFESKIEFTVRDSCASRSNLRI